MTEREFLKRTEKRIAVLDRDAREIIARIKQLATLARDTVRAVTKERDELSEQIQQAFEDSAPGEDDEDEDEVSERRRVEEDEMGEVLDMLEEATPPDPYDISAAAETIEEWLQALQATRGALVDLGESLTSRR